MKDVIYLLFDLLTTVAKLLRPGGNRTVIAENLLLKQQLITHSRSRHRAPNLTTQDRAILGFWSLFLNPKRIVRAAIIIKPSTLLSFHNALKNRKYRLLYSPGGGRKPGPRGPSWLTTIGHAKDSLWSVDLFRCESIILKTHWLMVVMAQYTRRIIGFAVHAGNVDGLAICRMFNDATSRQGWSQYLSSDNDPLFQYHRWKANLRVLEIEEIKSLPHVLMSHPSVERLIGSIRREMLDHTLFWTASDLENKLQNYQRYYNVYRCHSGRAGVTPVESGGNTIGDINQYRWEKHCRGLFQLPAAA